MDDVKLTPAYELRQRLYKPEMAQELFNNMSVPDQCLVLQTLDKISCPQKGSFCTSVSIANYTESFQDIFLALGFSVQILIDPWDRVTVLTLSA